MLYNKVKGLASMRGGTLQNELNQLISYGSSYGHIYPMGDFSGTTSSHATHEENKNGTRERPSFSSCVFLFFTSKFDDPRYSAIAK